MALFPHASSPPGSGRATRASKDGIGRFALLSGLGATGAVLGGIYAITGQGVPCPFQELTGWSCPVCGSSRMGVALLQGDLAAAWGWNPFLLVLGVLLGAVWLWTGLRLLRRRPIGLPGIAGRLDRLTPGVRLAGVLVPALVFTLVRNLL